MPLVIKNLTKSFGDKEILNGFSYTFEERGIYAFVGESGVGKTTLLRMISGLDTEYSGEISGVTSVSFAFQEHRLFPVLTALENVVFAISDTKSEAVVKSAEDMLASLGIDKKDFSLMPSELSGGMKQRVSLARAFLRDAPILLLDEPTGELDEENASLVREAIKKEAKKRLVILVSHNKKELDDLSAVQIKL